MKKKKTGRIVAVVIVLVLALLIGAYFVVTRVLHLDLPFSLPFTGALGSSEETVYVQSVANILGVGYTGRSNRYSGVVEAKEVIEINPDSSLTIAECYVKAGDPVNEGMALFAYDVESLTLSYEQLLIDISGSENTIRTSNEEIESLEKRIAKAKESKQYELKLKLQEVQLGLKKAEYEVKNKRKQAEDLKKAIEDSIVKSPVTGRVRSVRSEGESNPFGGGQEQSNAYITIVAGTDYCVKGTVTEQTIRTLYEGMPVTVRSRVDENTFCRGEIYRINSSEPQQSSGDYYFYDGGSGDRASKYAFYVSVDSIEGLIMGQHVYIELGEPSDGDTRMMLPSYYLLSSESEGGGHVWAANSKSRIEKRPVTLGAYDENTDSFEIVSGLAYTDRIAFPAENIREGMLASDTNYADGSEGGMMPEDGMMPGGEFEFDGMMPDGSETDGTIPEGFDFSEIDFGPVEPDKADGEEGFEEPDGEEEPETETITIGGGA